MMAPPPLTTERHCLVTIGATARFTLLLTEIIQPTFLDALKTRGFTHLTVQCGKDIDWFRANLNNLRPAQTEGLTITAFDFVDDLTPEMIKCRRAQAQTFKRRDGIVICHAGTHPDPYRNLLEP